MLNIVPATFLSPAPAGLFHFKPETKKEASMGQVTDDLINVYFVPQPDITAHEVATILSRNTGIFSSTGAFFLRRKHLDSMPQSVRRHISFVRPATRKSAM
jgi:hypothetical protein